MTGTKATSAQPPWMAGAAWIQGRYRPIEEAKVSVLDLGLTRSDCTYDVVHVWRGRFYRLDAHLDRFSASLARLRLDPGYGRAEIEAILHGCVRQAGLREAYVSMTCTRGRMAAGSRDLRTARNTFYCFAVPFIWISSPDRQAAGASLWVSQVVRIPPQSVDPSVKNYHWLDLDLALLDAYDHDADLVVLRDLTGAITEGPGYNVFAHVDGRWLTPGRGTLRGITRQTVIELLRQAGQPVEEGQLSDDELRRAAEVLVTSTAGGIMPVTLIDGTPVGTGEPGPQTRQLRDLYWASHEDERYSTPVRYDEPDGQGTAATQSDHGGASWQRLLLAGLMSRAQRLTVVLGLNLALVAGLVVVGVGAHSVGVLAEGGDYLLDVAGAGLALLAIRLSTRRAGGGRPARYLRTTGFAALVKRMAAGPGTSGGRPGGRPARYPHT